MCLGLNPTELSPESRADLVRRLTIAGWLLLGGSIGFIGFQLERVRGVGEQPFAGVWDQRIEVLSFLTLPPNLVVPRARGVRGRPRDVARRTPTRAVVERAAGWRRRDRHHARR